MGKLLSLVAAFILLTSAAYVSMSADNSASAWKVGQSASAYCNDDAKISFNWSFENQEPQDPKWDIDVVVSESNSGLSSDSVTVTPGQTANGTINTDLTSVGDGTVHFEMTWTDGRSGVDSRSVSYDATECTQPSTEIEVCRDGAVITINEEDRLDTDTDVPCPTPEEPKQIKVCRGDELITINEEDLLVSDLLDNCPQTLGTQTLPNTGIAEVGAIILGVSTATAGVYGFVKDRRSA